MAEGILSGITGWMKDDTNRMRLAGLGEIFGAMDQGQQANVSPFLQAIGQSEKDQAFKNQLENDPMMAKFSAEERSFLTTLPPQLAQKMIAERMFAQPDPWAGVQEINGQLVRMGAGGPEVVGDYRTQQAADPWANMKVIGDKVVTAGASGLQVMGDFGSPDKGPSLQHVTDASGAIRTFNPQTGDLSGPMTDGKPQQGVRPLTDPAERAAWGIPESDTRPYALEDGKPPALVGDSKGVTVNNNMGGDKFDEAWATADAKAIDSVSTAGMAAMRNMPRIDQLDALLAGNPTGGVANLQVLAGEWGINTSGLDELQTAQAIINSMVPEQRQPGSGPMSDSDLALFKQSLPRIITQAGGNRLIIDTIRAISQYDAEGATIVQAGREGRMSRAQMFDALQKRQNPLAKFVAPSQARQEQTDQSWQDIGGVKIRRKGN